MLYYLAKLERFTLWMLSILRERKPEVPGELSVSSLCFEACGWGIVLGLDKFYWLNSVS